MIQAQMVAVLMNFLTVTCVNQNSSISCSSSKQRKRRGRHRSGRAIPNCSYTNFESGCKEQIQQIQKPAFSGVTWTNKNFPVTQKTALPWMHLQYSSAQNFSNIYKMKQTDMQSSKYGKRSKWALGIPNLYLHSGIQWHYNKQKILFNSQTHEYVMQITCAVTELCAQLFRPQMQFWFVL